MFFPNQVCVDEDFFPAPPLHNTTIFYYKLFFKESTQRKYTSNTCNSLSQAIQSRTIKTKKAACDPSSRQTCELPCKLVARNVEMRKWQMKPKNPLLLLTNRRPKRNPSEFFDYWWNCDQTLEEKKKLLIDIHGLRVLLDGRSHRKVTATVFFLPLHNSPTAGLKD